MRSGWDDVETARRYDEHTQRYQSYRERAERVHETGGGLLRGAAQAWAGDSQSSTADLMRSNSSSGSASFIT